LDISAIPPALSEMGPYPSIVRAIGRHPSMPIADSAIPYMAQKLKETRIVAQRQMIGIMLDMYPRASPLIMLGAGPYSQD